MKTVSYDCGITALENFFFIMASLPFLPPFFRQIIIFFYIAYGGGWDRQKAQIA